MCCGRVFVLVLVVVVVVGTGAGAGAGDGTGTADTTNKPDDGERTTNDKAVGGGGEGANRGTGGSRPCFFNTSLACSMLCLSVVRDSVIRSDSDLMWCVVCCVLGVTAADTDMDVGNVM